MKKIFLALVVSLCGLTLMSCDADTIKSVASEILESSDTASSQGNESSGSTATGPAYDGSKVTITFWHTMGSNLTGVLDLYLEDFKTLYPNITVEYTSVGGYNDVRDQCKTAITVGNQPNIAYCYPDHVALYNKAKAVQTLDDYINSTALDPNGEIMGLTAEQKADFIEGYYNEGTSFGDGKMYTMPFSKSTEVLYYDATFFEANNLTVPTTWDEMETVCAAIKAIDPNCFPLGYDSEANWFINMCEQLNSPYTAADSKGNGSYLFNNDTNKEFVTRFKEWYDKGYFTTQELYGAYTSGLFTNQTPVNNILTRCYMCIGSSAGATYQRPTKVGDAYPFEVGIASIPQADVNNKKVISQGPSVCIFKKSNTQEVAASWLLVKYLTTNVEFQAQFSMASGYVPVIKSVMNNEVYAAHIASADGADHIAALSAKVCMEQEDAYFTSPAFIGSSTARDEVGNLLVAVFSNTKSVKTAFEDAIDECEY